MFLEWLLMLAEAEYKLCAEVDCYGASADREGRNEGIGGTLPSVHCNCHSGPAGCSSVFFASASGIVSDLGACIGSGALLERGRCQYPAISTAKYKNVQHIAGCALLSRVTLTAQGECRSGQ